MEPVDQYREHINEMLKKITDGRVMRIIFYFVQNIWARN